MDEQRTGAEMTQTIVESTIDAGIDAARRGDVDTLREWLANGGHPNEYDAEGWTPLLAAAVRGQADAVELLLESGADPDIRHRESGALPIHFAGHSGNLTVAAKILDVRPDHLDAVWDINGHTLLLQAAFYGHVALAAFAVNRGANTAATTLRGLDALELAKQYSNAALVALLRQHEPPPGRKEAYFHALLERIAPSTPPEESAAQELSDRLVGAIQESIARAGENPAILPAALLTVRELLHECDVNRLGGVLRQPPLVVAVTGNNGDPPQPAVAELRFRVAQMLLENGADPMRRERHPMGVHAVIRASVFNHLDILKLMARTMSAQKLRDALNEIPIVNGLTALHDAVLRASMTSIDKLQGYLDQIRWSVENGARIDIEDFSGRTQRSIAEKTGDPERRRALLEALGVTT